MCYAFGVDIIFPYAFSADDSLDNVFTLSTKQIRTFQIVLVNEITKHASKSGYYKYVYLDYDSPTLEDYLFANRDYLLQFGNKYLLRQSFPPDTALKIEAKYGDPVVTAALRAARKSIRNDSKPCVSLSSEEETTETIQLLKDLLHQVFVESAVLPAQSLIHDKNR